MLEPMYQAIDDTRGMLAFLPGHPTIIAVIVCALISDFVTGFHDTANCIATSVLTRALSMRTAVFMAAGLNFLGGVVFVGVAKTIAAKVVPPEMLAGVGQEVVLATVIAAIIWNVITWRLSLPSSSTHALIGGLLGSAGVAVGVHSYSREKLGQVLIALVVSPLGGLLAGLVVVTLLMWTFRGMAPLRVSNFFRKFQVVSASWMAFSHGANDAQNSMGIITMALLSAGFWATPGQVKVLLPVRCLAAGAMGAGTAFGGWRIIKTLGRRMMQLQPIHGCAAETAGAIVVQVCTYLGLPISTTHVISSAIMGVGSARRLSAVRWRVAGNIVAAWLLTFPATALLGAIGYKVFSSLT